MAWRLRVLDDAMGNRRPSPTVLNKASTAERALELCDIAQVLDGDRPWSSLEKRVFALVAAAIALDGFDNQVLGFTIPLLVKQWGVPREAFAPVLASGFVGMVIGTAAGGWIADRTGRRPALIASVLVFGVATLLSAFAGDLLSLGAARAVAGLGLGATMPCAATLLAEYSPVRRRNMAITAGIVCIPLGGMLGGFIAAPLLPAYGWRVLFAVAGALPLGVTLLLTRWLPESPRFLLRKKHQERAVSLVQTMIPGFQTASPLYDSTDKLGASIGSFAVLLGPTYRRDSLALWTAFGAAFLATFTVYGWAPTFLTSRGIGIAPASLSLALFNAGGLVGALCGAAAIDRFGSLRAMAAMSIGAGLSAALLASARIGHGGETRVLILFCVLGAFMTAIQTTLYTLSAQLYPDTVRGSGVGAAAGMGRSGAIISSFAGAAVITAGEWGFFGAIVAAMIVTTAAVIGIRRHIPSRV